MNNEGGDGRRRKTLPPAAEEYQDRQYYILIGSENSRPLLVFFDWPHKNINTLIFMKIFNTNVQDKKGAQVAKSYT